jgi:hypothetical protein
MMRPKSMMLAVMLLAVFSGASANAETLRWPTTGQLAFTIELPQGWAFSDGGSQALISANNHESSLGLFLINDGDRQNEPLSTLAAEILEASQSPPYSETAPGGVAGISGTIFISTAANPNGVDVVTRLMLARIDATHVAALIDMMVEGGDPADRPRMDALISGVRLVGVQK